MKKIPRYFVEGFFIRKLKKGIDILEKKQYNNEVAKAGH